jgi:hypothetical protein
MLQRKQRNIIYYGKFDYSFTKERLFTLFMFVRVFMPFTRESLFTVFTKERLFTLFMFVRLFMPFIRESFFIVFTKERLFKLFTFTCAVYIS